MKYGFYRVACASPNITVADCKKNAESIIEIINKAYLDDVSLVVFPELCITGYTCSDLFFQNTLQISALEALNTVVEKTSKLKILSIIGLPIVYKSAIYNCAAVIGNGIIYGIVPKTNIPNYSEFYEARQFTKAFSGLRNISLLNQDIIPFGTNLIFKDLNGNVPFSVEICEDLWVPIPPSNSHALEGSLIIANLSASNEVIGKKQYRKMLVKSQSARLICAYLYANAGHDESTTDMIFSGHNLICENGNLLAESEMYKESYIFSDIDIERLKNDRIKQTTFNSTFLDNDYKTIIVESEIKTFDLSRKFFQTPFVPINEEERENRLTEIISMQAEGLAKRIRHTNAASCVIGLSGGLDSTLALLVTVEAFNRCYKDVSKIISVTMPCFGTTNRTYNNAVNLAKRIGVTLKEINISKAVNQHFTDIEHDKNVLDITYENSQARERTQVLMDIANQTNGMVIGTGDLSELALGWATYNGDHMSMYGVNVSIPKTLIKYLVTWFKDKYAQTNNDLSKILQDIVDTPVSPELLPPDEDGNIQQKTEDNVGPYELHDFFLYYMLRWSFSPRKIFFLAQDTFIRLPELNGEKVKYTKEIILKWLKIFYKRFFSQQFKRSCLPDGAKVGTVSLSPRGDWRMPSDASASEWLTELENI